MDRSEVLIKRYEKLILSNPGEEVPIARLAELVRARDGNLAALFDKLELRYAGHADKYAVLVAWAALLSYDSQKEAALNQLKKATRKNKGRPEAWQLLGRLQGELGQKKEGIRSYEKALTTLKGPARHLLLRELRDLSLDTLQFDLAQTYHRQLASSAQGNLFLQGELGRKLLAREHTELAILEFKRVVKTARGDHRALAPALRDLGQGEIHGQKYAAAIGHLKRASALSRQSPGLQSSIDSLLAEAHKKNGTLATFLKELGKQRGNAHRLALLARLHSEQGNTPQAIEAYERALRLAPKNLDLRLKVVRLYELSGQLEKATANYALVLRHSPRDVRLSLRYMEMLLAQGRRKDVLLEFDRIERSTQKDFEGALLLLDLAEHLNERERADALLSRLYRIQSANPRELVELGSRFYRKGETKQAHAVWEKIVKNRSKSVSAQIIYGEVLIDHEALVLGVGALKKAVQLGSSSRRAQRALALGAERAASQSTGKEKKEYEQESLDAWLFLLSETSKGAASTHNSDQALARRHIVRIYGRRRALRAKEAQWRSELLASPPSLMAGRLLVEAYLLQRKYDSAIATLQLLMRHRPGDIATLLTLEKTYGLMGENELVLATLEKLRKYDRRNSRRYLERMARAATSANDREAALRFTELGVKSAPLDAGAQGRLGDLYLSLGQAEAAENAYRVALEQDDRKSEVALKLALLLAEREQVQEALALLSRIIRREKREDLIRQASRRYLSLCIPREEVQRLEEILRPLAVAMPERSIYQSLLLETLGAQLYPLQQQLAHGSSQEKADASQKLTRLAESSTSPLLQALLGENVNSQLLAIEVLAHSKNRTSGQALLAYSRSSVPQHRRVVAILALGKMAQPGPLHDLSGHFFELEGVRRGPIALATIWAVAQSPQAQSSKALTNALEQGTPDIRAAAALALAQLQHNSPAAKRRTAQALIELLVNDRAGPLPRAAAALALTNFALPAEGSQQAALSLGTRSSSPLLAGSSLLSLARTSKKAFVVPLIARALTRVDSEIRSSAVSALMAQAPDSPAPTFLPSLMTPLTLNPSQWVQRALHPREKSTTRGHASCEDSASLLELISPDYIEEARQSLHASPQSARVILQELVLSTHLFGPYLFSRSSVNRKRLTDKKTPADNILPCEKIAESVRLALLPEIAQLAGERHSPSSQRLAALALPLLRAHENAAQRVLLRSALSSPDILIENAALNAVGAFPSPEALTLLKEEIDRGSGWAKVLRIASTLGEMHATELSESFQKRVSALLHSLTQNEHALVREEARAALELEVYGKSRRN